jgi:hypothetical protein
MHLLWELVKFYIFNLVGARPVSSGLEFIKKREYLVASKEVYSVWFCSLQVWVIG